ncbi:hypothetical protein SY85_11205 [Flavisolibacter tropicus]|uniref:Uncharacterized protein n=1 Tax=Flavisolibacter tropicus TaxID=1492898 RepID=A0A172TVH5_9BACT|nr:hypothetical protein SY85_11205 [Flavisolibacter tropicus]
MMVAKVRKATCPPKGELRWDALFLLNLSLVKTHSKKASHWEAFLLILLGINDWFYKEERKYLSPPFAGQVASVKKRRPLWTALTFSSFWVN